MFKSICFSALSLMFSVSAFAESQATVYDLMPGQVLSRYQAHGIACAPALEAEQMQKVTVQNASAGFKTLVVGQVEKIAANAFVRCGKEPKNNYIATAICWHKNEGDWMKTKTQFKIPVTLADLDGSTGDVRLTDAARERVGKVCEENKRNLSRVSNYVEVVAPVLKVKESID